MASRSDRGFAPGRHCEQALCYDQWTRRNTARNQTGTKTKVARPFPDTPTPYHPATRVLLLGHVPVRPRRRPALTAVSRRSATPRTPSTDICYRSQESVTSTVVPIQAVMTSTKATTRTAIAAGQTLVGVLRQDDVCLAWQLVVILFALIHFVDEVWYTSGWTLPAPCLYQNRLTVHTCRGR